MFVLLSRDSQQESLGRVSLMFSLKDSTILYKDPSLCHVLKINLCHVLDERH